MEFESKHNLERGTNVAVVLRFLRHGERDEEEKIHALAEQYNTLHQL